MRLPGRTLPACHPTAAVLRAAAGRPVFYAGNAFLFPGARTNLPGTYLGESVAAAAELIISSLSL